MILKEKNSKKFFSTIEKDFFFQNGQINYNFYTEYVKAIQKITSKIKPDLLKLNEEKKSSDQFVGKLIKKSIRLSIKSHLDKKPEVNFHIFRL